MAAVVKKRDVESVHNSDWATQAARPGEPGWKARQTDIEVFASKVGVVASCRAGGPFAVVYSQAPPIWAGGSTVELFGIVGRIRVSLSGGPVAIVAGAAIPISVGEAAGGCDHVELEVANPPGVLADGNQPLYLSLVTFSADEQFWAARYVELLDRLSKLELLLKGGTDD